MIIKIVIKAPFEKNLAKIFNSSFIILALSKLKIVSHTNRLNIKVICLDGVIVR